jgi:hypothetical protein
MTQSLALLLGEAFDYAGLYPPAGLSLSEGLEEYADLLEGPAEWLINTFVCPAPKLKELEITAQKQGLFEDGDPLGLVITLSPSDGLSPQEAVDKVRSVIAESSWLEAAAIEIALHPSGERRSWLKHLKKLGQELDCPVMLELGWSNDFPDFMVECITAWDEFGFKARLGGIHPEDTPSVPQTARFITECSSLDVPFKFTAGLHHPLRHHDPILGGWRHGFLNVVCASLSAVAGEASAKDVERILDMQGAGGFAFGDERMVIGSESFSIEELEVFADYCHGIGSCSIMEPYEGLVRLGLVEPSTN